MMVYVLGGITVDKSADEASAEQEKVARLCGALGLALADSGHELVICSPFSDSADYAALCGHRSAPRAQRVHIYYPDAEVVRSEVAKVAAEEPAAHIERSPQPPLDFADEESRRHAWLLSQLKALDHSAAMLAVGGRPDRTAAMLLSLAEDASKAVVPIPVMGGAAAAAFHRRRYRLADTLGSVAIERLETVNANDAAFVVSQLERLASDALAPRPGRRRRRKFFLSYARARPCEADHVETVLRRRDQIVLRDERDIEPAHDIPQRLRDFIHEADVFIAIWCSEYACSPWCFDELVTALNRRRNKRADLALWILAVDETRMVHPDTRSLSYFRLRTRVELEGKILDLLDRLT